MSGQPAARLTDMHICPLTAGVPMPIIPPTSINVLIGFLPAARMLDRCVCVGPPPAAVDAILFGSPTVLINGQPAARMGDPTVKGGAITTGLPTVLIGVMGMAVPPSTDMAVLSPICLSLQGDLAEVLDAREQMSMADHVYGTAVGGDLQGGWEPASDDDLRALGLMDNRGESRLEIPDTDFRSEVFTRTDPATGESEYTIAFRGTTGLWTTDNIANAGQGLSRDTQYYRRAIDIGRRASNRAPGRVRFTGHSLGGGLASAAAGAGGAPATTFNAAGLSQHTINQFADPDNSQTIAYFVDGDILSAGQDGAADSLLGRVVTVPVAVGERRQLPQPQSMPRAEAQRDGSIRGWFRDRVSTSDTARQAEMHGRDALHASLAEVEAGIRDQIAENGCL